MERVAQHSSFSSKRFFQVIDFVISRYISAAILLVSMVGTAQAAVYIGGSPTTAVSVPAAYNFKPWVSAPANSKLTFSVAGKPYWATFNTTNGALSGKVYAANIGTYSGIRISVTDGKSKASTAAFAVKVATGTTTTPPTTANLQLSSSSYTVAQSAGALTVTVQRTGATNTTVSTAFATANGSAVAGTDYTSASGTLNWASGDTAQRASASPCATRRRSLAASHSRLRWRVRARGADRYSGQRRCNDQRLGSSRRRR